MLTKSLHRLSIAWQGIRENPYHVIVSLSSIGVGINMIFVPQPFTWPPYVKDIANDHGFDAVFVFVGVMMLLWVTSKSHHQEWDAINLMLGAFIFGTLAVYQVTHVAHTGAFMPWVQDAAMLALIVVLAVRSDANEVD